MFLAFVAFVFNVFYGVSITVMVLSTILIWRGPWMLKNLIVAKRAERGSEKEKLQREAEIVDLIHQESLELISEEQLPRLMIALYLASNAFIENVREIIEF